MLQSAVMNDILGMDDQIKYSAAVEAKAGFFSLFSQRSPCSPPLHCSAPAFAHQKPSVGIHILIL